MFFRYNLSGMLWAVFILILYGLPGHDFPDLSFWELLSFDKFIHAFMFAVLVLLLIVGFKKQYSFIGLRYDSIKIAVIVAFIYGSLLEFFQEILFVERYSDWLDFTANSAGCLLGVAGFYLVYGKQE